jgi:hypothetical protein
MGIVILREIFEEGHGNLNLNLNPLTDKADRKSSRDHVEPAQLDIVAAQIEQDSNPAISDDQQSDESALPARRERSSARFAKAARALALSPPGRS